MICLQEVKETAREGFKNLTRHTVGNGKDTTIMWDKGVFSREKFSKVDKYAFGSMPGLQTTDSMQ